MKNKKTLIIVIASVVVIAIAAACIAAFAGGNHSSSSSGSGDGDSGAKLFSPQLIVKIEDPEISIVEERDEYTKLDTVSYYYNENLSESDIQGALNESYLPSFKVDFTLSATLKNNNDATDRGYETSVECSVKTRDERSPESCLSVEWKNGKLNFKVDLNEHTISRDTYLFFSWELLKSDISSELSKYDALNSSSSGGDVAELNRSYADDFGNFGLDVGWATTEGTTFSNDKFVILSQPIDGGTVDVDIKTLRSTSETPSPYERVNYNFFSLERRDYDAVSESFRSLLEKEEEINFECEDLIEYWGMDSDELHRDESFREKESYIALDKSVIEFKKTIGYQTFVFRYDFASYYGWRYSEGMPITADYVNAKYYLGQEAPTETVRVTVFGQTANVTATYTVIENDDHHSSVAGYTVNVADLPLFFADKLTENCTLLYTLPSQQSYNDVIPYQLTNPDSVSISVPDTNVQEYCENGLANATLTYIYGDKQYSDTFKNIVDAYYASGHSGHTETLNKKIYSVAYNALHYAKDSAEYTLFGIVGSGRYLVEVRCLSDKTASDEPYVFTNCKLSLTESLDEDDNARDYWFTLSVKVAPYLYNATISDGGCLAAEYWQGDGLTLSSDATLTLEWKRTISMYSSCETETVPMTQENIVDFNTEKAGDYVYVVTYGGRKFEQDKTLFTYKVKADNVVSIEVLSGSLLGPFVVGEDLDLRESKIKAEYQSGKTKDVEITSSMVSGYNKNAKGAQTLTIAYGGKTVDFGITVKQVSSLSIYEAPSAKYCINQKPEEILIKAVFESSDDYDIISVPQETIEELFDTETKGDKTFTYTYGGQTAWFNYTVYEFVYLYYTEDGLKATITGMNFTAPEGDQKAVKLTDCVNISIETVDGLEVEKIEAGAFSGQSGISTIRLPETVIYIGDNAFSGCTRLKTVNVPSGASVGKTIFKNCNSLENLSIPGAAQDYLYLYFAETPKKSGDKVTVPANLTVEFTEGTTTLSDEFFDRITNQIKKVVFPSTQTSLGTQSGLDIIDAFESKSSVVKVIDEVLYTESGACLYYYPKKVTKTELTLGEEVTSIETVKNNEYLETVVINGNLTKLAEGAFYNCTALSSVTFNGSLDKIPQGAFDMCEKLTEFVFPKNLTTIEYAFSLVAIENVRIPDSVTFLHKNAFYGSSVKRLYIPSSAMGQLNQGESMQLYELEELAYDGSIPLSSFSAYRDGDYMHPQKLKVVYITKKVCDNFAKSASLTSNAKVYLSKDVTEIGSYVGVTTLYTERTSASDINVDWRAYTTIKLASQDPYIHWWEA